MSSPLSYPLVQSLLKMIYFYFFILLFIKMSHLVKTKNKNKANRFTVDTLMLLLMRKWELYFSNLTPEFKKMLPLKRTVRISRSSMHVSELNSQLHKTKPLSNELLATITASSYLPLETNYVYPLLLLTRNSGATLMKLTWKMESVKVKWQQLLVTALQSLYMQLRHFNL